MNLFASTVKAGLRHKGIFCESDPNVGEPPHPNSKSRATIALIITCGQAFFLGGGGQKKKRLIAGCHCLVFVRSLPRPCPSLGPLDPTRIGRAEE